MSTIPTTPPSGLGDFIPDSCAPAHGSALALTQTGYACLGHVLRGRVIHGDKA